MKKLLLFLLALMFISPLVCQARINVFEPWYPGLDAYVNDPSSSQLEGRFISGEQFWELPAEFSYVTSQDIEVGGRWGVKSHGGNVGIGDLLLGGKYLFVRETDRTPAVAGEFAVSLPTGKFADGLGTGSVDFLLQWLAKREFKEVSGTFGLGMRFNSENSDKYTAGNIFFYQVGISKPCKNEDLPTIYLELKGSTHGSAKLNTSTIHDSDYQELYLVPGADIMIQRTWLVNASLLIGLSQKSSDVGILVNTKF